MPVPAARSPGGHPTEVLRVALRLGLTSFGGPIAHLGYFERTYVRERLWLSGEQYAALVGLCQILPGPTSSQVGFLIGLHRAGWRGVLAAWRGFTLPSALLLYGCARLSTQVQGPLVDATVHGLKLVAVAVVAQAVWSMARRLCTDASTRLIAFGAAALLLASSAAVAQLAALAAGFAAGLLWCQPASVPPVAADPLARGRTAWLALATFSLLLLALPQIRAQLQDSIACGGPPAGRELRKDGARHAPAARADLQDLPGGLCGENLGTLPRDATTEQIGDLRSGDEVPAGSELGAAGAVVAQPRGIQGDIHESLEIDPAAGGGDARAEELLQGARMLGLCGRERRER